VARNVMKRHERVRHLIEQGLWPEGRSVLGLPKIKQAKVKARKAAAKEEKAEGSAEAPAAAAPAAKPSSK
jgi:small basic protein (TIGR04137 family)